MSNVIYKNGQKLFFYSSDNQNNKKQYTQKAAIINSEISANTLRNKRKYTKK